MDNRSRRMDNWKEKLENLDKTPPEMPHPGTKENGSYVMERELSHPFDPAIAAAPTQGVGGNQQHPPLPKPEDVHRTNKTRGGQGS